MQFWTEEPTWDPASLVTVLYGVTLFGLAGYFHLVLEVGTLDSLSGPLLAFLLDGGFATGVVAVGIMLAGSRYPVEDRQTATVFGVGGSLTFTLAMGATILIRTLEGRQISEWEFLVFTSLGAGYLSGVVGGIYRIRAREETREMRRTRDALAFVNGMLRHDVRNDANVIAGYAGAIDADTETTEVVRERAETVVQRTEQARAVAETVAGDADPDPIDPVAMIEDAVGSARTTFTRATFEVESSGGLTVRANEAFRPALDNLIENAVEHHDRSDPTIRVTAEQAGESVRIRVIDDGPGIPESEVGTLFEHDGPGTAKGLHVVETIVDGLDGTIRVENRADLPESDPAAGERGTAFVIDLPSVESVAADVSTTDTADPFV
ncbi:MAG: ATP-binding protein [Halobaculum sp.]